MTPSRIAGAPISWGVCEVPGWGPMLSADRVLRELRGLGLDAIELGAPRFLPEDGDDVRTVLDPYGVQLIGGFVPLVLHDPAQRNEALGAAKRSAKVLERGGATRFVTAVVTDVGWSPRRPLTDSEWNHLLAMLAEVDALGAEHHLVQVLHSHMGTLVETAQDGGGGQPPSADLRLRAHRVGRLPGRAQQRVALAFGGVVRLRVRLQLHGLRDVRRMGRRHGARRPADAEDRSMNCPTPFRKAAP